MAVALVAPGDEQLPSSKGTLYTVPASTSALVTIVISHTGAVARTANLFLRRSGGTSRRIVPKDLELDVSDTAYVDHEGRPFAMAAGDLIEGDASAAAEVDYTIDGMERSA